MVAAGGTAAEITGAGAGSCDSCSAAPVAGLPFAAAWEAFAAAWDAFGAAMAVMTMLKSGCCTPAGTGAPGPRDGAGMAPPDMETVERPTSGPAVR